MKRLGYGLLAAGGGAALLLLPQLPTGSSYFAYMLNLTIIYAIAALGLNLLIGIAGQISLGHAAFMAIGAYTSGLLTAKLAVPFPLALVAAAAFSGAVGFLMGLPALRLSGPYLALATISFGTALPELLGKWEKVTGGHAGVMVPRPQIGPLVIANDVQLYYLTMAMLVFLVWFTANLLKTRHGRAWQSLRESETAAQSMGVNVALAKTSAFALSAAYAGIAGSLYAHLVGFISPIDFNAFMSGQLLAMIVVGGLASISGSIAGAAGLTLLLALLSRSRGWSLIVEGVLVIATVWILPGGLISVGQLLGKWRRSRPGAGATAAAGASASGEVSRSGALGG
jgi:branched-chain amino acid transport system permease protein